DHSVLECVILTAVRSEMACELKWTQVRPQYRDGVIDFARTSDNTRLEGGHKMETRDEKADYTVPLTPDINALLKRMEEQQKRDGIWGKCEYVFVHSTTRGQSSWFGETVNVEHLNTHLKQALKNCGLYERGTANKKMPCVHGFRNTFPEWARELNSCFDHKIV